MNGIAHLYYGVVVKRSSSVVKCGWTNDGYAMSTEDILPNFH